MPEQRKHYTRKTVTGTMPVTGENQPTIDYEAAYNKLSNENNALKNKLVEYEKIINAYAQQTKDAQGQLQKATLEYNSRCEYMLDVVKHAYISIQLAYKGMKGDVKND